MDHIKKDLMKIKAKIDLRKYEERKLLIDNTLTGMVYIKMARERTRNIQSKIALRKKEAREKDHMQRLLTKQREVVRRIDEIENKTYRTVLKGIYIDNMELHKVAEKINKDSYEVTRIIDEALIEYGEKLKERI